MASLDVFPKENRNIRIDMLKVRIGTTRPVPEVIPNSFTLSLSFEILKGLTMQTLKLPLKTYETSLSLTFFFLTEPMIRFG